MTDDFVTQLRLQLREAALREERRGPVAQRVVRARRSLPGAAPVAVALAVALLALAVALGAVVLRGQPEPAARPEVIGTYRVASGLSPLAPGFGAVWTADPIRGQVLRIDVATRRVVARIPVHGDALVSTGAGAVWALAGDLQFAGSKGPVRLLRIDPATNRVVARIALRPPAGGRFAPIDLQIDRGTVWVIGQSSGALRIDPGRNVPDLFVPLADATGEPRGIVTDRDSVWLLTAGGRLRQYDARTGRVAGEVRLRASADWRLFWGPPGTLTLTSGTGRIALLERASGRLVWRATLGGDIHRFVFDDDLLWVHVSGGIGMPDRLVRLDVESGRRRGQVDLPERGVAGMAEVGRDVWVATPGGALVVVRR